jgi:Carboxypeptidase regulatory-like domain
MITTVRISACALIAVLWAGTLSHAQQSVLQGPQTGTIVGTVLDISGGTVPNATVALQGPNEHRTVVTSDNGFFTFNGINPDTPVQLFVSASGLKSWASNEITLQPGQSLILTDVTLGVAPVETSVNASTPEEIAAEQVKVQEQQRVFGVIPNFYVTYEHNAAPLTPKLKFQLALRTLTDPVTIAGFGLNAAIYQAAGYPSFGQDAKGFGQRLGVTAAGGYTKILLGDAVLPSLLHQDPRYFYQGTGTVKSRLLHAMATPFVTKGDGGRREINYSNIIGDLASGAIANAYYPSQDRGAGLVARSALVGIGSRMALGVLQEFVLRNWTSRHSSQP